jgi:chromatin structure-remodeling complex subunit SFH1
MPLPHNARELGIDETHPAYKTPDVTPAFRLKDTFLWKLPEALTTPDMFAKTLVDELDLPTEKKVPLVMQISQQIRSQLEDYSQAALHPLFNPTAPPPPTKPAASQLAPPSQPPAATSRAQSHASTPAPATGAATPLPNVTTNGAPNGVDKEAVETKPDGSITQPSTEAVSATAVAVASDQDVHNPDDTYRCIIELRINLMNKLYSDKFEWSLLHPPGFAEAFARQTCADLGLNAEWVSAMAHAIYEAVYRLRKDSLDNGLPGAYDLDTDAAEGVEAGWRYEPERLALDWAPIIETLSKEEIENREKERERNMRRMRRETNRYVALPTQSSFFADPAMEETPMGRGERSKKKRRFRSLSPLGRETPETGAYGGGTSLTDAYVPSSHTLSDYCSTNGRNRERQFWRCEHCRVWGSAVWAVREGPNGPRTLCNNCGLLFERNGKLPPWSKDLFAGDKPYGSR